MITRFAPAPTGLLHLGHVANALFVWGIARRFGGRVLLRIEDHDRTRCRREFERAIVGDLEWLGFEPDAPFVRQSDRLPHYEAALAKLSGFVYPCDCTRSAVQAAAPAEPGDEPRYPGTCRLRALDPASTVMRRVRLDSRTVAFRDLRLGPLSQTPALQCGDVLARDRAGNFTYQFAVAVDDFEQDVDLVIRGEDLLESTGRQIQLAELLGRVSPPHYFHHPLLYKSDGAKLSKSNRDTGVADLRAAGLSAARVRGLAAAGAALLPEARDLELAALPELFASLGPEGVLQ